MSEEQQDLLEELNPLNIEARYQLWHTAGIVGLHTGQQRVCCQRFQDRSSDLSGV